MVREPAGISDPIEISSSPAIISNPIGIATIPSDAATLSQLAAPVADTKLLPPKTAKKTKTATKTEERACFGSAQKAAERKALGLVAHEYFLELGLQHFLLRTATAPTTARQIVPGPRTKSLGRTPGRFSFSDSRPLRQPPSRRWWTRQRCRVQSGSELTRA